MVKRGLFVGRFQPFQNGHLQAVKDALDEVDELVIVVGSAQYSHTLKDPFTVGERLTMIHEALQEAKVPASRYWIVPVPDVHMHMLWVAEVIGYTPQFHLVYANEPVTKRLFKEAGFKVKPFPLHKREVYSSTEIRKRMIEGKSWKQLVPKSVAVFIEEINGVQRLRDLARTDKV
jgi:nicotinamide-nucleotide adenylyltransferase